MAAWKVCREMGYASPSVIMLDAIMMGGIVEISLQIARKDVPGL
jgi:hypothetical protein